MRRHRFKADCFIAGVVGAAFVALTSGRGAAQVAPPPWQRTETRAACGNFNPLRQPFFGETHVHTGYSVDAVILDDRNEPRDAYRFATGLPIGIAPYDMNGAATRSVQLRRPLDFAAVTDHSEGFGTENICLDLTDNPNVPLVNNPSMPPSTPGVPPTIPGYNSTECTSLRSDIGKFLPGYVPNTFLNILLPSVLSYPGKTLPMCANGTDITGNSDDTYCRAQSSVIWQAEQDAAEEFYDRTATCAFTTFVGYEWTGTPAVTGLGNNLHRNVIFRNAKVPVLPISYINQSTSEGLWAALQSQCLDGTNVVSNTDGTACDVLAIPHNSNVSGGLMFEAKTNVAGHGATGSPVPYTAGDAATQKAFEPLVEIFQHKGDSECRPGVDTTDELCGFEKVNRTLLFSQTIPSQVFPSLSFVRNGLKEGLRQEELLGVNPYQMGFVGGTDSHNATPSQVDEDNWQGHVGTQDGSDVTRLSWNQNIENNPGGLAVVWAEENSRDALFAAMRRREVYATSGTRPIVRLFAGQFPATLCNPKNDLVTTGYSKGAPMGSEIGALNGARSPKFAVLATKDPGGLGAPSTQLQRIQMVKGWIDDTGTPQEEVFDIAGNPSNGASVNLTTCTPQGTGFDSLCTVWKDPHFKASQRAFYYARVLENPTCRWSTQLCNANHIDCSTTPPAGFEVCCGKVCQSGTNAGNNSGAPCNSDSDCTNSGTCMAYPKTIQERAWTSPIWYRPEAIGTLHGKVLYGATPGTDVLKITTRNHSVPATVDPNTQDLVVTLQDDDTIFDVTVPAGTMKPPRTPRGLFVYKDKTGALGGIASLSFSTKTGALALTTIPMALPNADRLNHMVELKLTLGMYQTSHARLWTYKTPKRGLTFLSTP